MIVTNIKSLNKIIKEEWFTEYFNEYLVNYFEEFFPQGVNIDDLKNMTNLELDMIINYNHAIANWCRHYNTTWSKEISYIIDYLYVINKLDFQVYKQQLVNLLNIKYKLLLFFTLQGDDFQVRCKTYNHVKIKDFKIYNIRDIITFIESLNNIVDEHN